jgi:hypothetical protein
MQVQDLDIATKILLRILHTYLDGKHYINTPQNIKQILSELIPIRTELYAHWLGEFKTDRRH